MGGRRGDDAAENDDAAHREVTRRTSRWCWRMSQRRRCRSARVDGSRHSGKGEGVSGRIAVGGVTKVDIHAE